MKENHDKVAINRKWHKPFQMKWKSSMLDDLEGQYALLWLNCMSYLGNNAISHYK